MSPTDIPGVHDMSGNGPVWGLVATLMAACIVGGYLTITRVVSPMFSALLAAIKSMSEAVDKNSRYLRRLMGYMQGKNDIDDIDDSEEPEKRPSR